MKVLNIRSGKFGKELNFKDLKSIKAFINAFIDGKFKILTKLDGEKKDIFKLNLEEGLDLSKIDKAVVEVMFTNAKVVSKDYLLYLDPVKDYLDKGNLDINVCLNNVFLEEEGDIRHVSLEEILDNDLLASHDLVAVRSLFRNNNEIEFGTFNAALPYEVCSVFASYSEISESASKYSNIISISNNVIYYLKEVTMKPQPGELYLHKKGGVYKILDTEIKIQINDVWEDAVLYELDKEEVNSSSCNLRFVESLKDFLKSFTKCKR